MFGSGETLSASCGEGCRWGRRSVALLPVRLPVGGMTWLAELPLCVHAASLSSASHLVCKADDRRVARHRVAVAFVFSQIFLTCCVCARACVRRRVRCVPQGLLCCKCYPRHLQQYCLFLFSVTLFIMDSIKHYYCVRQPPSLPLLLTPVIPPLSFNLKAQSPLLHSPVACR